MRLIDADELKKRAEKVCFADVPDCGEFDAVGVSDIDIMPTIDTKSLRPTAKLIVTKTPVCGMYRYECSSCGALRFGGIALHINYCSICGKRIVNEDD